MIGKIWYRIARFFVLLTGKIYIPYKREVSGEEMDFLANTDLLGCVIIARTPKQLSNFFIRGKYKHAMLCDNDLMVVESISDGVVYRELLPQLAEKSAYLVLRPRNITGEKRKKIVEVAKMFIGFPYDFIFCHGNKSYYCSELILKAYNSILQDHNHIHFKGDIIEPMELLDLDYFEIIYSHKE